MSWTRSSSARVLLVLFFFASPVPATAQSAPADTMAANAGQMVFTPGLSPVWSPGTPVPEGAAGVGPAIVKPAAAKRPAGLAALYVSFAALQVLDAASTFRALDNGAVEANPLLSGVASNRGAMLAIKAGTTAATLYLTERLWKKNRTAAIVLMVCANSAYATIVANNYRVGNVKR